MDFDNKPILYKNPLSKHFRQPSIYFKLPSQGRYWPHSAIEISHTNEVGVMSMTTKDEITLKTPDALLNGQGVVDVIQSCCPSIIDAWQMPSIDVDATLIAIRIASYGNQMDFASKCPVCEQEHDYSIDLGVLLSSITVPDYSEVIEVDGLTFKFKPQTYYNFNKNNMIVFEEQQILRALGDIESDPEAAKVEFDRHLNKVVELNLQLLSTSTEYIETEDGTRVSDPDFLLEFYSNASSTITRTVKEHIDSVVADHGLKSIPVICHNEECNTPFDVDITFEYSSFFGTGS